MARISAIWPASRSPTSDGTCLPTWGPRPAGRSGHAMSTFQNKVVVLGGESFTGAKPDDPATLHVLDTAMKNQVPTDNASQIKNPATSQAQKPALRRSGRSSWLPHPGANNASVRSAMSPVAESDERSRGPSRLRPNGAQTDAGQRAHLAESWPGAKFCPAAAAAAAHAWLGRRSYAGTAAGAASASTAVCEPAPTQAPSSHPSSRPTSNSPWLASQRRSGVRRHQPAFQHPAAPDPAHPADCPAACPASVQQLPNMQMQAYPYAQNVPGVGPSSAASSNGPAPYGGPRSQRSIENMRAGGALSPTNINSMRSINGVVSKMDSPANAPRTASTMGAHHQPAGRQRLHVAAARARRAGCDAQARGVVQGGAGARRQEGLCGAGPAQRRRHQHGCAERHVGARQPRRHRTGAEGSDKDRVLKTLISLKAQLARVPRRRSRSRRRARRTATPSRTVHDRRRCRRLPTTAPSSRRSSRATATR